MDNSKRLLESFKENDRLEKRIKALENELEGKNMDYQALPEKTNGLKKIHCGLLYDLEKATLIHICENGLTEQQNGWTRERLYRTEKGAFFLYGQSNTAGMFVDESAKYDKRPGDAIIPLDGNGALDWLEDHRADAELTLKHFAELIEEA